MVAASIADVGLVETALAVRSGDAKVAVSDAAICARRCSRRTRSSCPTPRHRPPEFMSRKCCSSSALPTTVAARLKIYPNGATAMRHLAASDAARPIGCTQSTEIISTTGVVLSGSLPPGCELATMYTAAVTTRAANAGQAKALIDLLTAADQHELRERAGFLSGRK